MEPFRVIIDEFVYYNRERKFNTEYKLNIINIFNKTFKYQGKKYTLKDIIRIFVKNALESVDNQKKYKEFIYYEG